MKEVNKIYVITPTGQIDEESFWNEELWKSEHVLYATQRTRGKIGTNYQKTYISKIAIEIKDLSSDEQGMLYNVLIKYFF